MAIKTHTGLGQDIVIEAHDPHVDSRTLFVEPFGDTVLLTVERGGEISGQFNISPKEFAALAAIVAELEKIGTFNG